MNLLRALQYPIHIRGSRAHFGRRTMTGWELTSHGPQEWPWWRLLTLSLVRLSVWPPSFGHRVWIYTRWGATFVELYVDRRELAMLASERGRP